MAFNFSSEEAEIIFQQQIRSTLYDEILRREQSKEAQSEN